MLAKERLIYILERLQNQPTVSISELCKELNVSVSTVKRDLKKLEDEGQISRERGGAINKSFEDRISSFTEAPVIDKLELNYDEKLKICEEAAKKINDGDLIFIDSGTTTVYLLPYIQDREVKIVTNSTLILRQMGSFKGDIYMLGGLYSQKNKLFADVNTLEHIKKFKFDHAFISANGIDIYSEEAYVTDFDLGAIKNLVMSRSKFSYLLVDDSKYSISAMCTFANLSEFDYIFVNEYPFELQVPKEVVVCK